MIWKQICHIFEIWLYPEQDFKMVSYLVINNSLMLNMSVLSTGFKDMNRSWTFFTGISQPDRRSRWLKQNIRSSVRHSLGQLKGQLILNWVFIFVMERNQGSLLGSKCQQIIVNLSSKWLRVVPARQRGKNMFKAQGMKRWRVLQVCLVSDMAFIQKTFRNTGWWWNNV